MPRPQPAPRRPWRALIASLAAATLAGCATLGPDHVAPQPTVASQWQAAQPHEGDPAQLAHWWAGFDDPVLSALIAEADASSPTLQLAAARIDEARATLTVRAADALPSLDGAGSLTRNGVRRDVPVAPRTSSAVTADAGWEIDLFGRVQRRTEAAEARVAARTFDWHAARVSLAAEVASSYVRYRACRQLEAARLSDVDSRAETARLTGVSVDAGFAAPANAELARASLADARADLASQQAECEQTVKALVALTGLAEPGLRARLADGARALPVPVAFRVEAVPLAVLAQRPDVAAAERELAAASAEIGEAEANRYPRLSLLGSISLGSVRSGGTSTETTPWSIGPSFSLPLFDGGAGRAGVRAAEARHAQQRASFEAVVRTAV